MDPSKNEVYVSDGEHGNHRGQFNMPHSIATDSKGKIYVTETLEGKRIQRFLFRAVK